MSTFIQLHFLTNYAPANLNRDDLGRPKTAKVGGVDRLRISSQSLKRAWRTSDVFMSAFSENIGIRTKKFGIEIFDYLKSGGMAEGKAKKFAQLIASQFGKLKGTSKENELQDLEIEQLAHIDPTEKSRAYTLCDTLIADNREPLPEELEILREKVNAIDIALFGRMLASSPKFNVEAAAQVAHSITVNRIVVEDDYFTAVDDLNKHEEDSGSAHIGEAGFGAGVFYTYVCINKSLLVENVGSEDLANKAIRAFTEAAATVAPSGKQNSFASRARALYICAEKGTQQPRQLSLAFLKPVDDADIASAAIDRIETLRANMDVAYGKCADATKIMKVLPTGVEGTFAEILDFVGV